MSTIQCPHCQNQIVNNPQYAGQIVGCPFCQGQIQMPITSATTSHQNQIHESTLPAVFCVNCGYQMINDGSLAGNNVACPQCRTVFQMPGGDFPAFASTSSTSSKESHPKRRRGKSNVSSLAVLLIVLMSGCLVVVISITATMLALGWNPIANQPIVNQQPSLSHQPSLENSPNQQADLSEARDLLEKGLRAWRVGKLLSRFELENNVSFPNADWAINSTLVDFEIIDGTEDLGVYKFMVRLEFLSQAGTPLIQPQRFTLVKDEDGKWTIF